MTGSKADWKVESEGSRCPALSIQGSVLWNSIVTYRRLAMCIWPYGRGSSVNLSFVALNILFAKTKKIWEGNGFCYTDRSVGFSEGYAWQCHRHKSVEKRRWKFKWRQPLSFEQGKIFESAASQRQRAHILGLKRKNESNVQLQEKRIFTVVLVSIIKKIWNKQGEMASRTKPAFIIVEIMFSPTTHDSSSSTMSRWFAIKALERS